MAKAKDELTQCGQPNGFTHQHLLPRRAAEGEGDRRGAAAVAGQGRHQARRSSRYPLGDYFKLYAGKPDFAKANNLGLIVNGWGADWPDGFGFLSQIVDSRVIRATGGNSNLSASAIPEVDALLDKAVTDDRHRRARADLGRRRQEGHGATRSSCPGIWAKGLLYRPPNLTNVFVTDGFQMYDYLAHGHDAEVVDSDSARPKVGEGSGGRPRRRAAGHRPSSDARHTSSGG